MAFPIIVFASTIEPTPILYEQGGICYNPNASFLTTTSTTDIIQTEATSTNSEVVFVEEIVPVTGETCVTGVRLLGANVPKGNAIDLPTGDMPVVGGVIKLKYGEGIDNFHMVYIQAILRKGFFVQEYNYYRKGKYNERFIYFKDPAIVGFWQP